MRDEPPTLIPDEAGFINALRIDELCPLQHADGARAG